MAFAQSFAASSNTIFKVHVHVLGVPTCTYSTCVDVLYYAIYLIQAQATTCSSAVAGGDVDTRVCTTASVKLKRTTKIEILDIEAPSLEGRLSDRRFF